MYDKAYNNFLYSYDNCTLLFFYFYIVHTIILCSTATLRKFQEQMFESLPFQFVRLDITSLPYLGHANMRYPE